MTFEIEKLIEAIAKNYKPISESSLMKELERQAGEVRMTINKGNWTGEETELIYNTATNVFQVAHLPDVRFRLDALCKGVWAIRSTEHSPDYAVGKVYENFRKTGYDAVGCGVERESHDRFIAAAQLICNF